MAIENKLAEFITGVSYKSLGEDVKHEVKRRFIDALGGIFIHGFSGGIKNKKNDRAISRKCQDYRHGHIIS
jgi:2-methylcitrate dehydratase PrpD